MAYCTYDIGIYNADNNRPVQGPDDIATLVEKWDLDVGLIVEAAKYAKPVRDRIGDTHRVLTGRGSISRQDSMVIARRGLWARAKRVHDLKDGGWERGAGNQHLGLHPGRHMTTAMIGRGRSRLRVGAPHLSPGPHDSNAWPLRARSHRRSLGYLRRMCRRWNRWGAAWTLGGDWNRHADDMGEWLTQVDAEAVVGNRIDWGAVHGARILWVRRVKHGSGDHGHAIIYRVAVDTTARRRWWARWNRLARWTRR